MKEIDPIAKYFGKDIKVTIVFVNTDPHHLGETRSYIDYYTVFGYDADGEVEIKRTGATSSIFTISRTWFTAKDSGRSIEILN